MNKPNVSKELIEYLEVVFQDRCPDKTDSERQIWMDVGAVSVVRHLKSLAEAQVADALRNKTTLKRR